MINDFDYINELLTIYKHLLTDKQADILEKYYRYNLSLSEIGEDLKISRSAVSYAIEHAKNKILSYEEKLHLNEHFKKTYSVLNDDSMTNEEKIKKLKEMQYGI